ncbi:MAG: hypothetical protein V3V05_05825 [Pontiella sp.]
MVTFVATNLVAGDYAEHMLDLYLNNDVSSVEQIPVSMWVLPSVPVIVDELHCSYSKANELFWTGQAGPVQYWIEAEAIEHCAPGYWNDGTHGKPVPLGWLNTNRFDSSWNHDSGWVLSTNFLFHDLRLNTKYKYQVKAGVMTDMGWLESA